jgi:delta24-sterol reductase
MQSSHAQKVARISRHVTRFYINKTPFKVFHGSTNSTRVLQFKKDELVDISDLNKILSIDTDNLRVHVEPNVPMDRLVRATLKHGLIPPVVMEFPGITVGGAIQGNGGESSSFKWGAFNQTVVSHEIVVGNGDIFHTSAINQTDLFYGVPGTAGTVGILTAAEIDLIPAKKYVVLEYFVVRSFDEAQRTLGVHGRDKKNDFIDGIMFAKDHGVVIVGRLSNRVVQHVEHFRRARDEWYYLHVESSLAEHPKGWRETVPLEEYLFRYDRGAFWVGRFAFDMFKVPYTRLMRLVLNPILNTRKLYQALQESGQSQLHIVQDLVLPVKNFTTFCNFLDQELETYPLWLCPMRVDNQATFQLNNLQAVSIINVGVWGAGLSSYEIFVEKNRAIERRVLELGGKKWSYAYSFFTKKEFWSMYDQKAYTNLRKKYHSSNLPTIHDKITVKGQDPIQIKKALLKTIFGISKIKVT